MKLHSKRFFCEKNIFLEENYQKIKFFYLNLIFFTFFLSVTLLDKSLTMTETGKLFSSEWTKSVFPPFPFLYAVAREKNVKMCLCWKSFSEGKILFSSFHLCLCSKRKYQQTWRKKMCLVYSFSSHISRQFFCSIEEKRKKEIEKRKFAKFTLWLLVYERLIIYELPDMKEKINDCFDCVNQLAVGNEGILIWGFLCYLRVTLLNFEKLKGCVVFNRWFSDPWRPLSKIFTSL